ncbi:MAG: ZIP family metal transporter [Longimicrobiales bacterium]
MGLAFFWGAIAASSLVLGAILALSIRIRERLLGSIMAFGSGVLVAAVAYELVLEAAEAAARTGAVASGMFAGALTFYYGDALIEHAGRSEQNEGSAFAIALGTVLDGIPESIVLGLTLLQGKGSIAMLAAVFISNVPEAIASTTGLAASGWSRRRILILWTLVLLASAFAAMAGFAFLENASDFIVAFILSFAGGAILTMLAQTMMLEAGSLAGHTVGLVTTFGFAVGYALHLIE